MSGTRWRRWRDWPLGAKSAAAVAVPLGLLLVALMFSYRLQQGIAAADADVRRALAIQAEIQVLHTLVAEAAMSVRGYLLTGRDDFLAPYRQAQEALPGTLDNLRRNIRDPQMKQRLEQIQSLLQTKLASLEDLRRTGRDQMSPSELQEHLQTSKAVLDELRTEIRGMNAREADLVAQYSAAASAALRENLVVDGITSVLVLGTGIGAFLLLFSGVVRRVQRLAVNAEHLVNGDRLEALPEGRDELGLMAERLHNASLLLAARAAEARSASLAKTQFLSRTSHELRTPLNAILGFAQILELDARGTPQAAQVEQILGAGRHLLSLIDEVLDIARIESGELRLAPEPLVPGPLAAEARDLIAPMAAQHGVSLLLAPGLSDVAVLADRQRLRQVLLNLLSNAVKFNRAGGEVHVTCRADAASVWITVRDTGIGIAADRMDRLFTPFDRLDAEQGPTQGTGLGLAVSRELMRHMGGDIEVQSAPGRGSTFALRLPRATLTAADAESNPHAAPAAGPVATSATRCVLVIEDNASNLALMQALVARRPRWRLEAARDGVDGLERARALRPQLVLLDLHLPRLDGQAVLAELRADPLLRHTPVVIVSADALPATVERLRAAGATDYLTKPLSVPRFLDLLDRTAP